MKFKTRIQVLLITAILLAVNQLWASERPTEGGGFSDFSTLGPDADPYPEESDYRLPEDDDFVVAAAALWAGEFANFTQVDEVYEDAENSTESTAESDGSTNQTTSETNPTLDSDDEPASDADDNLAHSRRRGLPGTYHPFTRREQPHGMVEDQFSLYYFQDRVTLDPTYLNNANQMDSIVRYLAASPRIDSITIYAYASPEGVYQRNVYLARRRAEVAKQYILDHLPEGRELDEDVIRLRPMNENWEGLYAEIEDNYHRDDRDKVLEILLDTTLRNDTKKWRLQRLDYGRTWQYIIRHHMPRLRLATWICVWQKPYELIQPKAEFANHPLEMQGVEVPHVTPPREKHTILAVKTNMLYDLATVLNFSVEVPFSKNFSLLYEHHCPWWLTKSNKYCLQYLAYGGEFRWWFKPKTQPATRDRVIRDALQGHFLGLYGFGGKLDFQNRRNICYQANFFTAGLTYGYSMPLSKRLNIEFSLSVGYASIPYWHYNPSDDWELLFRDHDKTGRWHWIGPTKAEIALVVPIVVKRGKNSKKGGYSW